MKFTLFYHSLISDWNHGNAHFLRGVVTELLARGHQVDVYEPENGWSFSNLLEQHGLQPVKEFAEYYPQLYSRRYNPKKLDLHEALDGSDVVIVHEWNDHELVADIGRNRRQTKRYKLFFHDTHHRSVTQPQTMGKYDLSEYDGVLAFGQIIKDIYIQKSWADNVWVWHEAADTRIFRPFNSYMKTGDSVWIGNWGDEERTTELFEYMFNPIAELQLRTQLHGVRYPPAAIQLLKKAGIKYCGWLPNYKVPEVFGSFRVTIHVPRRPYVEALPGIPTIRPFEAMACGIPLLSAPWEDTEGLFREGSDFLMARNGREMKDYLQLIINDPDAAEILSRNGREQILRRHTCSHRVDQLIEICAELGAKLGNVQHPQCAEAETNRSSE